MKRSLCEILKKGSGDSDEDEDEKNNDYMLVDDEQNENENENSKENENEDNKKLCIECGDQPAEVKCINCNDIFCTVCFTFLHRTGNRSKHKVIKLSINKDENGIDKKKSIKNKQNDNKSENYNEGDSDSDSNSNSDSDSDSDSDNYEDNDNQNDSNSFTEILKERAKYIPLRLSYEERKYLRLLEAALNVSEYTDKVDIFSYTSKSKRIVGQIKEMCSILTGLVVAADFKEGQELLQYKEFSLNKDWFKKIFEIGRRYKIMNPERLRDSFGKLMYMIMDSRLPEIEDVLEFNLWSPILTVYNFLQERDALDLLSDNIIQIATMEIIPDCKSRYVIKNEIKKKEKAIELLAKKYSKNRKISSDDIRLCLYSIGDNHSYLRSNQAPVESMIKYLEDNFSLNGSDSNSKNKTNLAIRYGKNGARLSHSHEKQFAYVYQSLSLWSLIMKDMFKLWLLADTDLLGTDKRPYKLMDTGQGLNRVQACPNISRAMHEIIFSARKRTSLNGSGWIGSSVVHLGDHAVPNAWFFLDKYLQVPRILNPLTLVMKSIENDLTSDKYVVNWINSQFNSLDELKYIILIDFFKHAFDGSGADNFYDAGSCIDGRLTSAWNWANSISKKPYYKLFLLTGFTGFNGSEGF